MSIKREKLKQILFFIILLYCMFPLEAGKPLFQNHCTNKKTCRECIQTPTCAWCLQKEREVYDEPRCFSTNMTTHSCPEEYVYHPNNLLYVETNIEKNLKINLRPQKLSLRLKLHEPISFTVDYNRDSSKLLDLPKLTNNATEDVKVQYSVLNILSLDSKSSSVQFKVDLKLEKCPEDPKEWTQLIAIFPEKIDESLYIDLEMICSCSCEYPGDPHYEENSVYCHHSGTYKCGVCEYDKPRFFRSSECTNLPNVTKCKPPYYEDSMECSGRGVCICGQCECDIRPNTNEVIYGTYCECDNFSCERHNGLICSGHGSCECGLCKCDSQWIGSACECISSPESCVNPFTDSQEICSNHGECVCGACECSDPFRGQYCEQCSSCPNACDELKPCIMCEVARSGPYNEEQCLEKCRNLSIVEMETIEADETNNEVFCNDDENCKFVFTYKQTDKEKYFVKVQHGYNCTS